MGSHNVWWYYRFAQDTTSTCGNLDLNGNNITGTGGIPSANLTGTIAEARLPAAALGAVWESKSANFTAEARKNCLLIHQVRQ